MTTVSIKDETIPSENVVTKVSFRYDCKRLNCVAPGLGVQFRMMAVSL